MLKHHPLALHALVCAGAFVLVFALGVSSLLDGGASLVAEAEARAARASATMAVWRAPAPAPAASFVVASYVPAPALEAEPARAPVALVHSMDDLLGAPDASAAAAPLAFPATGAKPQPRAPKPTAKI
jgi:hypothetical protein